MAGVLELDDPYGPFQPKLFYDSTILKFRITPVVIQRDGCTNTQSSENIHLLATKHPLLIDSQRIYMQKRYLYMQKKYPALVLTSNEISSSTVSMARKCPLLDSSRFFFLKCLVLCLYTKAQKTQPKFKSPFFQDKHSSITLQLDKASYESLRNYCCRCLSQFLFEIIMSVAKMAEQDLCSDFSGSRSQAGTPV